MHTGYDNFWMHNNSRHKPVLNLPKNDNCSYAQLTDCNKQAQNARCPGRLNGFMPPQNIAATSLENDQYRKSFDQSMWPSSVYSLPFMSSHANNFASHKSYNALNENFVHSTSNSQTQESCDVRHLEVPNGNDTTNAPPLNQTDRNIHSCAAQAQINKNINAQLPRIRVRDVFSLNNSTIPNQLEVDGNLHQTPQKELLCHSLNFANVCHNRKQSSQTETQYKNYEKCNLADSSQPSQREVVAAEKSHLINQEQTLQHSGPFQQQNAKFSPKNFEFDGSRKMECSLPSETFERVSHNSLLRHLLNDGNITETEMQNCQRNISNSSLALGGVKISQKTSLSGLNKANDFVADSGPRELKERLLDDRSNPRHVTQVHSELQDTIKVDEANLAGHDFASNTSRKSAPLVTVKGSTCNDLNDRQNFLIKITVPHTGESSFISLDDCGNAEGSSAPNFQTLETYNEHYNLHRKTPGQERVNDEENGVSTSLPSQVGQRRASTNEDFFSGCSLNDIGSEVRENCDFGLRGSVSSPTGNLDPTNQGLHRQGPFATQNNKPDNFYSNSVTRPENVQQEFNMNILGEDENIPGQEIAPNDVIFRRRILKQEHSDAKIKNDGLQRNQNILGEKVLNWTIKMEGKAESLMGGEREMKSQFSENSPTLPADIRTRVDEFLSGSNYECPKFDENCMANFGDCVHQMQTSKNKSSRTGVIPGPEKENGHQEVTEGREVDAPKKSYKSNINRDKLDLLIQFLKNDEEFDGDNAYPRKGQTCSSETTSGESKRKKINSNHNRRKLSKACIVRNKNNSREMISLMSPKGSTSTSRLSQITTPVKELKKTEDRKSVCATYGLKAGESVNVSKKPVKYNSRNNPCRESEMTKNDPSLPETCKENVSFSEQIQEYSEKPPPADKNAAQEEKTLVSAMKAFQNFKSHFCMSCNLVSSIDSFWINVISGELRCLNCFKKMTLKVRGNVGKTDDVSVVKPLLKSKAEKESKTKERSSFDASDNSRDENGKRQTAKSSLKCECACRRISNLKENDKQELLEGFGSTKYKAKSREDGEARRETTNCPCVTKRRSSSEEGAASRKEKSSEERKVLKTEKSVGNNGYTEEFPRKKGSETDSSKEMKRLGKIKRKSSSGEEDSAERERSSSYIKQMVKMQAMSTKEQLEMAESRSQNSQKSRGEGEESSENHAKKEKKADVLSNIRKGSDNAKEEFKCHKIQIFEDRTQKEVKQARHNSEESARKSLAGEGGDPRGGLAAEGRRNVKHKPSDKTKTQKGSREGSDRQKPRRDKQFELKSGNSERARKSISCQKDLENRKWAELVERPRKRRFSGEDSCVHKVHVAQDITKADTILPLEVQSSKSLEARVSKEGGPCQRRRLSNSEKPGARHSAQVKSIAANQELVEFGERPKKEAKLVLNSCEETATKEFSKVYVASQSAKSLEHSRCKTSCLAEPPRKENKGCFSQRPADSKDSDDGSRRGHDPPERSRRKPPQEESLGREVKRECFASEDEERKMAEEKEEREKLPKSESLEPVRTSANDGQPRKPEAASKTLKERQNTKAGATTPKEKLKAQTTK